MTVLLAFTCNFTSLHWYILKNIKTVELNYTFLPLKSQQPESRLFGYNKKYV